MMSHTRDVGQNLKAQENWWSDNHTSYLILETGMVESLNGLSSSAVIAKVEANWCQTLTKTQCKLLHAAAVQVSTSGQACSQDKKMYSKKSLHTQTHAHILRVWNATTGMHSWTPADIWLYGGAESLFLCSD